MFPFLISFALSCGDNSTEKQEEAPNTEDVIQQRIEAGGPIFTLDLTQAERLIDILKPEAERPIHLQAFHIDSVNGEYILYRDQKSPTMDQLKALAWGKEKDLIFVHAQNERRQQFHIFNTEWKSSPEFISLVERIELGDDRFLVHLQQPSQFQLLAFHDGGFVEGPTFEKLESHSQLANGDLILNLKLEDTHALYSFDGSQFQKLIEGDRISSLKNSPDDQTYTYVINKDRQSFYGIGTLLYTRAPVWKPIGEKFAYLGIDDLGEEVFVDYKGLGRYERISSFKAFDEDTQLHFVGSKEDAYTLHYIDPKLKNHTSQAYTRAPNINYHHKTKALFWLGQSDDGVQLGLVNDKESIKSSENFEKINIESRVKHDTAPIATALTFEKMTHVLTGTSKGPEYEKVERLQTMKKGAGIVYVGQRNEKVQVVQDEEAGESFDKVFTLGLTKPSGNAYYHASLVDNHYLVYGTEKSVAVNKVSRITTSNSDDVAWQGDKSDSVHVGLNSELYDGFDSIQSIQFSPKDVLWYDAKRGDSNYRGIKAEVLGPFTSMSRPVYSSTAKEILFAARSATKTERSIKLIERIYKSSSSVKDYEYQVPNDNLGQRLASNSALPKIQLFKDSDSFFYQADLPDEKHVGFNSQSWGPFDDVKFLKRWPFKESVVFASQKNDVWSAQISDSRQAEVDDVLNLKFTKDNKKILYDVKIAGEKFVYVGADLYQSIKDERLSPRGDFHTFQGKKDDQWMLIRDEEKSVPFIELGRTQFTPDSYGIEAIARDSNGKKLVQKLYQKDFAYSDSFDSLSSSQYYHFALKEFAARKLTLGYTESELEAILAKEYDGPLWVQLVDDEDNVVPVDSLDNIKENVFLSVASSLARVTSGYRILKVDKENNRFVLHGLMDFRNLRQSYSTRPMILRLHDRPFSIKATHERKSGRVHSNQFFTKLESPHPNYFTENGYFHAIGRGAENDFFIVDHQHSEGLNRIKGLSYSNLESDASSNRLVLLTSNDDRKNPWKELVLIDNSLKSEHIDGAKTIESTPVRRRTTFKVQIPNVDWIRLSNRDESTVIWNGESHRSFVSVHNSRYDSVSDLHKINGGLLAFYMGHRKGLSSIYTNGAHHPWYTEITDVNHNPDGEPIYLAHQIYQHSAAHQRSISEVTTFKSNRRLTKLVHGENNGPWQDKIHSFVPDDQFEYTAYIGVRDDKAQLHLGDTAVYKQYDDIGWLHIGSKSIPTESIETENATEETKPVKVSENTEQIPGKSIHYLARTEDQWNEVHDGVEGNPFDGLEEVSLGNEIPGSYTKLNHQGQSGLPTVYIDKTNRYFYRAKVGEKDAIVHQGQQSTSVEGLRTVWLYNDGQLMTFNNILPEGQQVYAAGALSEVYHEIQPPLYQQYSQNINFVAVLSAPEIGELTTSKWHQFSTPESLDSWLEENELEAGDDVFKRFTVLHNIEPTGSAWSVTPIRETDGVPAIKLSDRDVNRIWINGQEGPAVDSVQTSNAYWGASLEESRYEVSVNHQKYIAESKLRHGPFDSVSEIKRLDIVPEGNWVWAGRIGNIHQLYVDDALYDSAHQIHSDRDVSNKLLTYRATEAHNLSVRRGDSRFDQIETYTLESINESMLRIEKAGLNWIEFNDLVSEKSDIFYALDHIPATSAEAGKLVWLGGSLDQEKGTLDVQIFELELTSPPVEEPLRALKNVNAVADAE
ncbi:MAG: hypothetical protein VXZ96_17785 [Myxococcota bacterium]|nr:hypothetical protein [Myxococcota bacterium]